VYSNITSFFAELETNTRILDDERILSLLETCSDTLEHTTSCEHMLLIGSGKLWRISHVIREPVWQLCTMAGAENNKSYAVPVQLILTARLYFLFDLLTP
jgi:hypothetical protein